MKRESKYMFLIIILVATNIISIALFVHKCRTCQLWYWKNSMLVMAKYAAALQALSDFKKGELRIYEIVEDNDREFANRYEGPFEIWHKPYHPILGYPHKYATEMFVEMYNSKMRYMQAHPNDFKPKEKDQP